MATAKNNPYGFCSFFGDRLEFQSKILPTPLVILYAYNNLISVRHFNLVSITMELHFCHTLYTYDELIGYELIVYVLFF